MSGGDTRHLEMEVPIAFLCNSLGAAGFIKVYVFLLILSFRLTTTKGLLLCQGGRVKTEL